MCHLPQHTTSHLGGFGSSKKWSKKVGPRNLRSILVKLSRKSSQHMQKTPGSSPCIRQCNSGSQRLSFQQSCSKDKFPADSRPLAFPCTNHSVFFQSVGSKPRKTQNTCTTPTLGPKLPHHVLWPQGFRSFTKVNNLHIGIFIALHIACCIYIY